MTSSTISRATSRTSGISPTSKRAEPRWELAVVNSSFGPVTVIASVAGVRWVHLGETEGGTLKRILRRLGGVDPVDAGPETAAWAQTIADYCDGRATACDVPLDIQGTPFQKAVWQAISQVPRGSTASYSEIARQVDRPKAVRAVGTACGANPLAPMIPCHRILASDGSLGGYGFGLERKRFWLRREGVPGF